jgi:hypothetical protein
LSLKDLLVRSLRTNDLTCVVVAFDTLERDQCLVWAFDFLFGPEEFFAPRFACALGALVNRAPNSETVIAGPLGAGAMKLLACLAGLEELAFERSVLAPQFAFTDDAHTLLLTDQFVALGWAASGRVSVLAS